MSEWWTYRLDDFLLFSPRVYWRMFELHNAEFWPLHLLAIPAGLGVIFLRLRRLRRHGLWVALTLAVVWMFVGWSFLWSRYAGINWAIAYLAPAFGVQALLFVVFGAAGRFDRDVRRPCGWLGMLLATLALVAYPTIAPLSGRSWTGSEVFGMAPDPTAIFTLGILAATGGRSAIVLSLIPAFCLLTSGLTLQTMDEPQAWVPFLSVMCALVLIGADLFIKPGRARR